MKSAPDLRIRPADDPPSFLVIVIDADVASWACVAGSSHIPEQSCIVLQAAVEQVLVFLNTFLLLHQLNRAAVIVFGRHGLRVAYPNLAYDNVSLLHDTVALAAEDDALDPSAAGGSGMAVGVDPDAALRKIRSAVVDAVTDAISQQARVEHAQASPRVSAALATALCLINRRRALRIAKLGASGSITDSGGASRNAMLTLSHAALSSASLTPDTRILAILGAPDSPDQYIPVMNCIFAAQRLGVLIDTCMLHPEQDSTYFQQAAYLTKGVYLRPPNFSSKCPDALLQYLLTCFLADVQCREFLAMPTQAEVDFRASCFVTRKPISEGYTCSVCLSTFDISFGKKAIECPTCKARFTAALAKPPLSTQKRV